MASPTPIPHPESSAHHQQPVTPPPNGSSSSFSRSPTGTSPNPIVSPIYTSAGRSAFSLPGPNSSSTSPTTTSWYSAGFASNNSQRVRSPTSKFANSTVSPQRDHFVESNNSGTSAPPSSHFRNSSGFGSTSRSSSFSSADLMSEPTTPKPLEGGMTLGRVSSIPMGSSFEQIKGHRGSWGPHSNSGWNGLNNFRPSGVSTSAVDAGNDGKGRGSNGAGMSGILRKFSFGSGSQPQSGHVRAASCASPVASTRSPPTLNVATMDDGGGVDPIEVTPGRGRQASVSSATKRRPSPMGERLLMGHFNAH